MQGIAQRAILVYAYEISVLVLNTQCDMTKNASLPIVEPAHTGLKIIDHDLYTVF